VLFNSIDFLIFFPTVVALHWLLPHRFRWVLLLLSSYAFYMAWEPAYAILIAFSTVVDYAVARKMPGAGAGGRKALLLTSLLVNLGLLAAFKYYAMITSTLAVFLGWAGIAWAPGETSFLLPVGISFYTFQTLSYTIDVYRGKIAPETHLGKFALFVSFFPQLVAGPIERAADLLPQLMAAREWNTALAIEGMRQALWGMFKKIVVADNLAVLVGVVYAAPREYAGPAIVLATLAFAYQGYCDFSGYSDIAIGIGKVLGIRLSLNFDQPTLARSVAEFWSRWHITLIHWLRDYVYLPMGGSRVATGWVVFNVLFAFSLSGLWHGAAWHYVLWGTVNGVFIVVGRATRDMREAFAVTTGFAKLARTRAVWQWASTVTMIYGSFVLFRVPDIPTALVMYARLPFGWLHLGPSGLFALLHKLRIDPMMLALMFALIPLTDLVDWCRRHPERFKNVPYWAIWPVDWAMILGILILGKFSATQFMYFQF
jgi:D-alanyl-lipoteichoic acid acyltransferase DltB (MBOAT superfamily)